MPAPTTQATEPAREMRTLLGFLLALGLILALRALQAGTSLADVARLELFVAGWIVLPGWAFYSARRGAEEDGLLFLGMALASGLALEALAFAVLRIAGVPGAILLWPLAGLPWLLRRLRRGPGGAASAFPPLPRPGTLLVLLLLLAFVAARVELRPGDDWFTTENTDPLFHLSTAAEYANHWPMRDPRVATLPFNYHFLGYGFGAGAWHALGVPLAETMMRAGSLLAPVLLALQVWNCARLLGGPFAGTVALALLFLGPDIGPVGDLLLGPRPQQFLHVTHSMEGALYLSKPSPPGMLLYVSLIPLVPRYLKHGQGLLTSALFAVVLSGMKGSIPPVLLAGLGLDALVRLFARDPSALRAWKQLGVLTLASSIFMLWLTLGSGSYAAVMFHPVALFSVTSTGLYMSTVSLLGYVRGSEPAWLAWALLPAWLLLVLGPALVAALLRARREGLREHFWLWGTLVSGLVLSLGLLSGGNNQLFFMHPGQIALVILGASVLAAPFERAQWGCAALALACMLPWIAGEPLELPGSLREERRVRTQAETTNAPEREAMAWIRENTQPDALILLRSSALFVSSLGERRTFYECPIFTPLANDMRWKHDEEGWHLVPLEQEPDYDPEGLRARIVAGDRSAAQELRSRVPGTGSIYMLFATGNGPPALELAKHAVRLFRNAAFEIWRSND